MLHWLHSGFSVRDSIWLDQDDAAAHERLPDDTWPLWMCA